MRKYSMRKRSMHRYSMRKYSAYHWRMRTFSLAFSIMCFLDTKTYQQKVTLAGAICYFRFLIDVSREPGTQILSACML